MQPTFQPPDRCPFAAGYAQPTVASLTTIRTSAVKYLIGSPHRHLQHMFIPTSFRVDDRETLLAFMGRYGFATLVSTCHGALLRPMCRL
ncbi:MAG UNVERIFIED_CONTAM: hypothetical protein LVR18_39805 [Planctomycetaceae bacterium]